jgi:hypothetical protein
MKSQTVVYVLVDSYDDLPLGVYSSMDLGLAAMDRVSPERRRSLSLEPYELDPASTRLDP